MTARELNQQVAVMSEIPPNAVAVGTRECLDPANTRATCTTCGHDIYFRDVTPLAVPLKSCVECFLAYMEAHPEPMRVHVTPENVAFMRGVLGHDPGGVQ